jgi:L-ascorbate metabolism protein UlaG (beta-lactamase superfamily)
MTKRSHVVRALRLASLALGVQVFPLEVAAQAQAAANAAPQPATVRGRFIGNMALQLTDGRVTLRSDFPYEAGYSGYMTWTEALVPQPTGETLCLVTHSHRDHFLASLAARYCTRLLGPKDVTAALPGRELEPAAGSASFGPLRVTPLATPHARLEHYSYLVEWNGVRLYFTGDTDDATELLRQRGLDVAFVSPWLLRSATKGGARIDAKRIVVYHHEADEAVPEIQGRELPRQGDELVFSKERP